MANAEDNTACLLPLRAAESSVHERWRPAPLTHNTKSIGRLPRLAPVPYPARVPFLQRMQCLRGLAGCPQKTSAQSSRTTAPLRLDEGRRGPRRPRVCCLVGSSLRVRGYAESLVALAHAGLAADPSCSWSSAVDERWWWWPEFHRGHRNLMRMLVERRHRHRGLRRKSRPKRSQKLPRVQAQVRPHSLNGLPLLAHPPIALDQRP